MSTLISEEYRKLNAELHADSSVKYGARGHRHSERIISILKVISKEDYSHMEDPFITVLDYGAGKGKLSKALCNPNNGLRLAVRSYDPAVSSFSRHPREDDETEFDLVVCTDVLEHIEPEFLDNVLDDLLTLGNWIYLFIATWPDRSKTLPDGTNPHKSLHTHSEWFEKIASKADQHSLALEVDEPTDWSKESQNAEKLPFVAILKKN